MICQFPETRLLVVELFPEPHEITMHERQSTNTMARNFNANLRGKCGPLLLGVLREQTILSGGSRGLSEPRA